MFSRQFCQDWTFDIFDRKGGDLSSNSFDKNNRAEIFEIESWKK